MNESQDVAGAAVLLRISWCVDVMFEAKDCVSSHLALPFVMNCGDWNDTDSLSLILMQLQLFIQDILISNSPGEEVSHLRDGLACV